MSMPEATAVTMNYSYNSFMILTLVSLWEAAVPLLSDVLIDNKLFKHC